MTVHDRSEPVTWNSEGPFLELAISVSLTCHRVPPRAMNTHIVMYTVEILPYSLRAKGFNVFNFVISLALIFNQYVNPIALEHIAWKYYVSLFTVRDSYMTLNRAPTDRLLLLDRFRVRLPLHLHR